MKHLKLFEDFIVEKKPKGAPDWHDSDAPDAEGRFKDLSIKKLAAWLIKTRKKDLRKITGSLNQQIVFNRNDNKSYADKMEKTRKEVYKQLGREDLLKESVLNEMETAGWGNDPKKPKDIDRIENKVHKWLDSLKKGWTPNTQNSPKLARFRQEWEGAVEKHKNTWQPKYNFGDVLA